MTIGNQNSGGLVRKPTPPLGVRRQSTIAFVCACVAASCAPIIGIDELERVDCLGNCADAEGSKEATSAAATTTETGGSSGEATGAGGYAASDGGGGTSGDGGSSMDSGKAPVPDAATRDADASSNSVWYQIRNQGSSLCLDNLGSTSSLASFAIVERACTSVASQQWTLVAASGGCSHVVNRSSSLCLNNRGSLSSQTTIGQYSCSSLSSNLNWTLPSVGRSGHIVSCKSSQCLASGGTAVVQDVCNNSSSQVWSLVEVGY